MAPAQSVLNVRRNASGRTDSATQETENYNDTSAENVDTDSAKQVGTALMILNVFKRFIERFYVASPA